MGSAVGLFAGVVPQAAFAGSLGWGIEGPQVKPRAGDKVFVANLESSDVAVIDINSNTVIKRIKVGMAPHMAMVSPDGRYVYVTGTESDNVTVVDAHSHDVVRQFAVGKGPEHMNFTPDGKFLAVINHDSFELTVVDTTTLRVVKRIPVGREPENVTFSPDGLQAYVTGMASYEVTVIDMPALKTVASIPIGAGPSFASIQPLGSVRGPEIFSIHPIQRKAYVPNMDTHDVSIVDLETNQVVKVIPVGQKPHHSTISPDGRLVYVVNGGGSKTVSAIDTATDEVVATIFVGKGATGILFKP
ncbi:MAG: hypothetical protein CO149_04105, partial [Nitrospirae bacterium CG_4_9_14_3_um_filter_51_5]